MCVEHGAIFGRRVALAAQECRGRWLLISFVTHGDAPHLRVPYRTVTLSGPSASRESHRDRTGVPVSAFYPRLTRPPLNTGDHSGLCRCARWVTQVSYLSTGGNRLAAGVPLDPPSVNASVSSFLSQVRFGP